MDNLKLVSEIIAKCNERIRELKASIEAYERQGISITSLKTQLDQNESLRKSLVAKIKRK